MFSVGLVFAVFAVFGMWWINRVFDMGVLFLETFWAGARDPSNRKTIHEIGLIVMVAVVPIISLIISTLVLMKTYNLLG